MSTSFARRLARLLVPLPLLFASANYAAQRTFVSTLGSDASGCSLAAPCRSFAKAITATDVAGEIVVLDSGGYGAVTVNKNVSIVSPSGVYAGLSVFTGNDGITVAAPATKVVLRGLTLNGQGGNNGVRVQAGEVHLESLVISNMAQAGILVEGGSSVRISGAVVRSNAEGLHVVPISGTVNVAVRDSEFSNQSGAGVDVTPGGSATVQVTVERSSATKNGAGFAAAPGAGATAMLIVNQSVTSENSGAGVSSSGTGATVWVRESAATRNGTGLLQASSGVLNACGANLLVANGSAQSGSINTGSCLDVASANGTVTSITAGAGLTGGTITTSGTIAVNPASATFTSNFLRQGGNAFGTTATIGTTDDQSVTIVTNNQPTLRLIPATDVLNTNAVNVINGSPLNTVGAGVIAATIAGGGTTNGSDLPNQVTGPYGTVGGGIKNIAGHDDVVGGGEQNSATGDFSTISGGAANATSNIGAAISGGSANVASGSWSTVAAGQSNTASGDFSFAAGHRAKATTKGSFIWADSQDFDFGPSVANFFGVRATGGVGLTVAIDPSTGAVTQFCNLLPGVPSWQCTSDRNAKENFMPADAKDILKRLVAMPLFSWNFKGADPAIRSLGPTAQDFYAAFGLGRDDKSIANVNLEGVALAAIQGLHQLVQEKDAMIERQRREIADVKQRLARVESLRDDLAGLKAELAHLREIRAHLTARPPTAAVASLPHTIR